MAIKSQLPVPNRWYCASAPDTYPKLVNLPSLAYTIVY